VFEWNVEEPLQRCPGETRKANQALRDYTLMGPGRSLRKLHQRYTGPTPENDENEPPTRHLRTLKAWSARYRWQDRVEVWERLKAAEDEAMWDERRRALREREWEASDRLMDKVEQMLKFPVARVTREDGTTIEPARWKLFDVARVAKAASELGRLAAEIPPTVRLLHGGSVKQRHRTDWSGVTDEELDDVITNLQAATGAPGVGAGGEGAA